MVQSLPWRRCPRHARGDNQTLGAAGRAGGVRRSHGRDRGPRSVLDSLDRPFEAVTGALKYNVWHSLEHRALATLGVEATPPLGRRDRWELAPYLAAGAERLGFTIQGQAVASWEEAGGIMGASYRLGISHEIAARRLVPMIEAGWDVPRAGANALSLYPQLWIKLSRLGHVPGSVGAEVPVTGVSPPRSKLIAFLLWDFGDAPLLRGWGRASPVHAEPPDR